MFKINPFLVNTVKGNFGVSYNYREPVFDVIMGYLPFTLIFALIVVIVQFLLSFWLSFISISKLSSRTDMLISKFTLLLYSIPTFVCAVAVAHRRLTALRLDQKLLNPKNES